MSETPERFLDPNFPDFDTRLESLALRNRMDAFVLAQMKESEMDDAKQIQAEVEAVQLAMLEAQLEEKRLDNRLLLLQVERKKRDLESKEMM